MVFDNATKDAAVQSNADNNLTANWQDDAKLGKNAFMQNDKLASMNSIGHGDGCSCSGCTGKTLAMDSHKPGCPCCSAKAVIQA